MTWSIIKSLNPKEDQRAETLISEQLKPDPFLIRNDVTLLARYRMSIDGGFIISVIAVPVHEQNNGSFIGNWIGALNLKDMSQAIQE
jgi:hypothetical protein